MLRIPSISTFVALYRWQDEFLLKKITGPFSIKINIIGEQGRKYKREDKYILKKEPHILEIKVEL